MSFSLNEVEAMAKKAARGAGYPWGLAEEAGKATRFLCAHGLDGVAALADVIRAFDGQPLALTNESGVWSAPEADLCPIMLGAALMDRVRPGTIDDHTCESVRQPMLLLYHAAQIARAAGGPVTLQIGPVTAILDGAAVALSGTGTNPVETVTLKSGGSVKTPLNRISRARPKPSDWADLNTFAHRTYAPATEESRIKGAG